MKEQTVEYNKSATAPTVPMRIGYTFIGWDKEFNKVTSNLVVTAMFKKDIVVVTKYTVTFVDWDGKKLKEEVVEKGKNATPPTNPSRPGYSFTGWSGNYTNVQGNITIMATYKVINKEYDIVYHLNGGVWGYKSKTEYLTYFLQDFYDFVRPTETIDDFMYGTSPDNFMGSWKEYIGGVVGSTNKLLYDNDLNANNEGYFFNCSLYKDKWANLGKWVQSQNNRFAGNNYDYGALDFYRYVINDPDKYINVYGDNFYKYPDLNKPTKTTYKPSDTDILLHIPLNKTFEGWYLTSDFSGEKVTSIPKNTTGTFEVYAKWNNIVTYEVYFNTNCNTTIAPVTVKYGDTITLRADLKKTGYKFKGWYIGENLITSPFKFTYNRNVTITAKWVSNTMSLETLKYDGSAVKYRNSLVDVKIPTEYLQPDAQLRAVWVSSLTDDYKPSTNQATMKKNLLEVLDLMESFNLNCVMFHVRVMNDALYKTHLAPIDSRFGTYQTFEKWDYLTWFITECHNRGIEFHAWMNPYRIKAYGYDANATASDVSKAYVNYPLNPAHDPENILMTYRSDGTHGAILNPAKQVVQDYIVKVCLEVMENYDVDAIHFDDYFYAQMSKGIDVLNEPDQDDYINYINNNGKYNKNSSSDKKQWRRDNVDNFIHSLSDAMRTFNKNNKRNVQLGISPTGIYKNGTGSASSGSNTNGQEHYSSYLFCDTVNWIKHGWIDYILPQSYWAFTHRTAAYADVMDWWNKVVEGTNVNLYSGIGIYMGAKPNYNYSWGKQAYEVSNQVLYTTKLQNVKGVCFFRFGNLKDFMNNTNSVPHKGLERIKNEYFINKVPTPSSYEDRFLN